MATTTITSSGSGIGITYGIQPIMSISDSIFVLDLNPDSLEALKPLCDNKKWNTISIMQLQHYNKTELFENALHKLLQYAIFKNQNLCDRTSVICIDHAFTEVANKVWPEEQRAITKFRGRKWPTDKFVKEFSMKDSFGSVSPAPEKIDPSELISWYWHTEYSEYEMSSEEYPYTPGGPIPLPLEDDVELPEPPEGPPGTTYTIQYFWWVEDTNFPLEESHCIPASGLTSSFVVGQNSLLCRVKKMTRVEIHATAPEDSGGA